MKTAHEDSSCRQRPLELRVSRGEVDCLCTPRHTRHEPSGPPISPHGVASRAHVVRRAQSLSCMMPRSPHPPRASEGIASEGCEASVVSVSDCRAVTTPWRHTATALLAAHGRRVGSSGARANETRCPRGHQDLAAMVPVQGNRQGRGSDAGNNADQSSHRSHVARAAHQRGKQPAGAHEQQRAATSECLMKTAHEDSS